MFVEAHQLQSVASLVAANQNVKHTKQEMSKLDEKIRYAEARLDVARDIATKDGSKYSKQTAARITKTVASLQQRRLIVETTLDNHLSDVALQKAVVLHIAANWDIHAAEKQFMSESVDNVEAIAAAWAIIEYHTNALINRARVFGGIQRGVWALSAQLAVPFRGPALSFGNMWIQSLRARLKHAHPIFVFGVPVIGRVRSAALDAFPELVQLLHGDQEIP